MFSLVTLGRLRLYRDGDAVPGYDAHRRALALLTVLSVEGSVSRDRLMALFWPESDAGRARGSLNQLVHQVRHLLGAPEVVQGSVELGLSRDLIESDVGRFVEALDRGDPATATALYTGPFLQGVHLGGPAELDQWAESRRADLARRWTGAVEQLANEAEGRADFLFAADRWRRLQEADPSDGRLTLRLMLALEASGRRVEAVQQAHEHERRLRREWDLSPDPAVTELAVRLQGPRTASLTTGLESGAAEVRPTAAPPEALASTPRRARRVLGRNVSPVLLTTGALLLATIGVSAVRAFRAPSGASAGSGDPNVVAVAPFQVLDRALELWHEGLPEILSRNLDGAGPIRTVPQAAVFRAWSGRGDRGAAELLGSRTGAGLVIFGAVGRLGRDSVAFRAVLLDRLAGTTIEAEARGDERQILELADSLSLRLLRGLGRGRPLASTRRTSIAAQSLPALKEFLRAEQFYRRGLYDSAMAHYDLALGKDPGFALALRQMSLVAGWPLVTKGRYLSSSEYVRRLAGASHALGTRDSLLFLADSLRLVAAGASDVDTVLAALRRAKALYEEGARRYADDPGMWYELGEFHYHEAPPFGSVPESTLAVFDRAIALDSGFGPAYEHTVVLALVLGAEPRARHYAARGGSVQWGEVTSRLRLTSLILDSGLTSPPVAAAIDSAAASTLWQVATENLAWWPDSEHTAIALLQELDTGRHDPTGAGVFVTKAAHRARELGAAFAYRGRLREAVARLSPEPVALVTAPRQLPDPFLDLALLGAVADSVAGGTFARGLDRDAPWEGRISHRLQRHLHGLPWWAARRDTAAIVAMATRAGEVAREGATPASRLRGQYQVAAARAWLDLARGDSASALRRFEAIPDTLCLTAECVPERLTLARLLAARGEHRRAAALLDRWTTVRGPTPLAVLARLERARIAERLADPKAARDQYRFVAEVWHRADPELQPLVAEARAGLARLGERSAPFER